jgi:hypothetical protein
MPVGERRLPEPDELWPQEQQLCVKATEGGVLDLRCRRPGEDDPTRGRKWGPQRRIRAQVLFQLLTGQGPQLAGPVVAVRLRGAQIVGRPEPERVWSRWARWYASSYLNLSTGPPAELRLEGFVYDAS